MKSVVVDTNVLIRFLSGDEHYRQAFDSYAKIIVPSVVIGEYKCGIKAGTAMGRRQKTALDAFMGKACVELATVGERETDWYSEIFQVMKRQGTPVPQNDMWIASVAMSTGSSILTDDGHFKQMPMLTLAAGSRD